MTGITEIAGRDVEFYMGDITSTSGQSGPPRICARTKTITVGGEPIDVTQDCDDGFRRLLGKPASRSIDMTVEGVIAQTDLIDLALDPTRRHSLTPTRCGFRASAMWCARFTWGISSWEPSTRTP